MHQFVSPGPLDLNPETRTLTPERETLKHYASTWAAFCPLSDMAYLYKMHELTVPLRVISTSE
jgi:hypothetical protein